MVHKREKKVFKNPLSFSEKFMIHEKKISSYKTRMILTINNLNQQDAGSYVCVSGKTFCILLRVNQTFERSFFFHSFVGGFRGLKKIMLVESKNKFASCFLSFS